MEESKKINAAKEEQNNKQIDFTSIAKILWPYRKKYCWILTATFIFTYLLTICVPRYYKCTVSLAPEVAGASMPSSLGSIASSFGLGNLAKMNSQDAIYSEIYPDVIGSKNFIADLMTVEITTTNGEKSKYYTYLRDKQKDAWWVIAIEIVKGWFKKAPQDDYNGTKKISTFNLTKQQDAIFNSVKGKLKCSIDKKTDIVSITVTDQDPLVCATIAEATCQKLQNFITTYRTNKARIDYEYYKKLYAENKKEYEKACEVYATYADAHQNVFLVSYTTKIEALENEMQQKYNIYTAINTQMQAAAARLQEATPAFTIIESASVPVKPAGPKRMLISIAMAILAFICTSVYILISRNIN